MTKSEPSLKRELGLYSSTLIIVGNVVGVGIFVSTGMVAEHMHSPGLLLFIWLAGGLFSIAGAVCFAEIGAMMPHAGGDYIYLRDAFGPLVAFLSGWASFLISFSGSIAALALGFSEYVSGFLPSITISLPVFGTVSESQLLAIVLIALVSIFNYLGVTAGSILQNVLTAVKGVAIIGLVFIGLAFGNGSLDHFHPMIDTDLSHYSLSAFGLALIPILFAYQGWNAANYIAGEIKDPEKNLPRSILVGIAVVVALYLLVNSVYIYALQLTEMKGVVNIAEKASEKLFSFEGSRIVSAVVSLSILGGLSTTILIGPRIYYAMAKDGLFFKSAAAIHPKYKTPFIAIFFQALWASLLILAGKGFDQLLTYIVFAIMLFSTLSVSAIFVFRRKYPDRERPYKAWGYPVFPILYIFCSLLLLVNTLLERPGESILGLCIISIGVPVYFWKKREI